MMGVLLKQEEVSRNIASLIELLKGFFSLQQQKRFVHLQNSVELRENTFGQEENYQKVFSRKTLL